MKKVASGRPFFFTSPVVVTVEVKPYSPSDSAPPFIVALGAR
jgi:hypothetical protein